MVTATGGSGNLVGVPRNWLCHDQRRSFEARFTRGGAGDARLLNGRFWTWPEMLQPRSKGDVDIGKRERGPWFSEAAMRGPLLHLQKHFCSQFSMYIYAWILIFLPILLGHITLYHNMLAQKEMTLKTRPLFLGWVPHSCILVEKYPYYRLSPFYSVAWLSQVPPVYFNGDILAVFGWTLPTLHSSGEIYRNSPGFLPVQNDSICTISFRVKNWVLEFGYTYIYIIIYIIIIIYRITYNPQDLLVESPWGFH